MMTSLEVCAGAGGQALGQDPAFLDGDAPATSSAFVPTTPPAPAPVMAAPKNDDRVTALEARVAALEARLTKLSNALGA
mgnify:CR=1 FL=1